MRIAELLGTIGAASAVIATSLPGKPSHSLDAAIVTGLPSPTLPATFTSMPTAPQSSHGDHAAGVKPTWSANATTPFTTTTSPTTAPNTTTSRTAELTGGAIPQQMQASMAGLLGFCIMGLFML